MSGSINFLGDITIFLSPELVIRNVNKSIFNFLQYTEEELIGEPLQLILPNYNLEPLTARGADYLPYSDTQLINRYGESVPLSVSASAIRDNRNSVVGFWLLLQDIEGRNQSQTTLRDMQKRYLAVTDHALDAVIVMDSTGRVTEWNPRAEIEFGWPKSEAVGRDLADLIIPPSYRGPHKLGLQRFMATGQGKILNKRLELSALHRDGHVFPVELTVTPIQWGDGYIFSAFVRNITERKNAEQELIDAKEKAEAATRAKSDFLAMMSHEIRTPLNGIVGLTHVLKDTNLTSEQKEYVDYIVKSENALLSIINDILDFSKIESGKVELEAEPFDLKACIEETFDVHSVSAQKKKLDISSSVDPQIPAVVVGDHTRLRQVLMNLVGNAIKFTPSGSVRVSIGLLDQKEDGLKLKFNVRDTGIGIPKEKLGQLFEPFSQLDSSNTRKYGGTGLGLAICKKLVQLMGGEIWLENSGREGADFAFTIMVTADLAHSSHAGNSTAVQEDRGACSVRILIGEDNEINQKVLLKMLEKSGYTADIAGTGIEVLECLKRKPYDLIFMDIQMPVMDGMEATRIIRETIPEDTRPKIIAVTANAFESDREEYLSAGMDDYISKPIKRDQLQKIISKFV